MNDTIYHCIKITEATPHGSRFIPPKEELLHQADSQEEAISWLERNGGGWYRDILRNITFFVEEKRNG